MSSVSLSETWAGRVRKQSAFSMMCDLQSQGVSDVSATDWRHIGRNPSYMSFIFRADNDLTISDFWTFFILMLLLQI